MTAGYAQPLYNSTEIGFEIEVESVVRIIESTPDERLGRILLLELHQHLLDYDCPLLQEVLRRLNAKYGHRRYERPPCFRPP